MWTNSIPTQYYSNSSTNYKSPKPHTNLIQVQVVDEKYMSVVHSNIPTNKNETKKFLDINPK
jgi:hypothetical protein